MTKTMRMAFTEMNEIIKYLPEEYINKIPNKFKRMFYDFKLKDYSVKVDPNRPLKEQKFVRETYVILAILKYNFWCESDAEKEAMNLMFRENAQKAVAKYDISALNSRASTYEKEAVYTNENVGSNLPVKVEKKSWLSKIISKIKKLFKN